MSEYKLRVKIGINEFDAEGPKEFCEELFKRFEVLVNAKIPMIPAVPGTPHADFSHSGNMLIESQFAKAFHLEGDRISLIGRFEGDDRELDAALLILLGHKEINGADSVTADELIYGLKQTGYTIDRADRLMRRGQSRGLLNFSGVRRGTKYRLTVPGITRAKELAKELLDLLQIS